MRTAIFVQIATVASIFCAQALAKEAVVTIHPNDCTAKEDGLVCRVKGRTPIHVIIGDDVIRAVVPEAKIRAFLNGGAQ